MAKTAFSLAETTGSFFRKDGVGVVVLRLAASLSI